MKETIIILILMLIYFLCSFSLGICAKSQWDKNEYNTCIRQYKGWHPDWSDDSLRNWCVK